MLNEFSTKFKPLRTVWVSSIRENFFIISMKKSFGIRSVGLDLSKFLKIEKWCSKLLICFWRILIIIWNKFSGSCSLVWHYIFCRLSVTQLYPILLQIDETSHERPWLVTPLQESRKKYWKYIFCLILCFRYLIRLSSFEV